MGNPGIRSWDSRTISVTTETQAVGRMVLRVGCWGPVGSLLQPIMLSGAGMEQGLKARDRSQNTTRTRHVFSQLTHIHGTMRGPRGSPSHCPTISGFRNAWNTKIKTCSPCSRSLPSPDPVLGRSGQWAFRSLDWNTEDLHGAEGSKFKIKTLVMVASSKFSLLGLQMGAFSLLILGLLWDYSQGQAPHGHQL